MNKGPWEIKLLEAIAEENDEVLERHMKGAGEQAELVRQLNVLTKAILAVGEIIAFSEAP